MQKDLKAQLLKYKNLGLPVFPVRLEVEEKEGKTKVIKRPLVSWKKFQNKLPSDSEIEQWVALFPEAGIGCATGKLSGIIVVDVDSERNIPTDLPQTVIAKSGSGGWHYYFKHPGIEVLNSVKKIHGNTDVRGDGGYIVLPPTKYPINDGLYTWTNEFNRDQLAELPRWIIEKSKKNIKKKSDTNWREFSQQTYGEGERNSRLAEYAGHLLSRKRVNPKEVYRKILKFNQECLIPPLSDFEVEQTFESIAHLELSKRQSAISPIYSTTDDDNPPLLIPPNQDRDISLEEVWSVERLLNTPPSTDEWLVDRLVPLNGITCIGADPKTGKSYVCLSLAQAVASGRSAFGRFSSQQANVLYIDKEDNKNLVYKRVDQFGISKKLPLYFLFDPSIYLENSIDAERLLHEVKKYQLKFIILDSLRRFFTGDENESSEINKIYESFKVLQGYGCTVLFTHHLSKPGLGKVSGSSRLRGSSDIPAIVDSLLILEKRPTFKGIKVQQPLLRQDICLDPFSLSIPSMIGHDRDFTYQEFKTTKKPNKTEIAKNKILNLLNTYSVLSTQKIKKLIDKEDDIGETTVKDALKELVEENKIGPANDPSIRGNSYRLNLTSNVTEVISE